jgi:hypothetical protein
MDGMDGMNWVEGVERVEGKEEELNLMIRNQAYKVPRYLDISKVVNPKDDRTC